MRENCCWAELVRATDAYEWSFVAVPAQRDAGVMKSMRQDMEKLEREAALGRKYLERLKRRRGGAAGGAWRGWAWSTPCWRPSSKSWRSRNWMSYGRPSRSRRTRPGGRNASLAAAAKGRRRTGMGRF